jgi:hypothetical protein
MIIGLITMFAVMFIHAIKVMRKGYDLEVLKLINMSDASLIRCPGPWFIADMCELLMWPIMIIDFIIKQGKIFDAYDRISKESE